MSGWRAIESGIISHGRLFEQRIRELQLEIEHMEQLREAAERGRGLPAMESSGAEPGPSRAIAEVPGPPLEDPSLEEFAEEPSSSGHEDAPPATHLSTAEKILYYAMYILHFGLSSEQVKWMENLMRVLYGALPPVTYDGHVREFNRRLLEDYNRKRYFYCSSCGSRLREWRELCENVGCALYRVSIKRAKTVQRTEIHVLNIIPQLSDIITNHIGHIISFHRELHEVGAFIAVDRSDIRYFDGFREAIETADEFSAHRLRILVSLSVDGFVPRRLSRREVWPLYLRVENLPRSEANDYYNCMLAGVLYCPTKPSEAMMETLCSRLESELNTLRENPILVDLEGIRWTVEVCLYRGVADMAAQKLLYGVPAWNRDYGCSKCNMKGIVEGRQRMWLAAREEVISLRTPESYAEDAHNFGQFGIMQVTPAMRLLLPCAFSSDSLHVCSEGVTRDRIRDMFDPGSKFADLRVDHRNTELIKTCLRSLSSHTYANSLILSLEDLKTCKAAELDELAFVTFPLVAATGMIASPAAAASLLGYWFCLRTMAHSKSLTVDVIMEAQFVASCTKQIWAEMAPEVFTMKCHWFFEHGMAEELNVYGSMYQWSSAPFESLHRRLQIRVDQSTTNSSIEIIERYLLSKRVHNMFNDCCEDGNTYMLALKTKIENKHRKRFPLSIPIDASTYIPKGSRIEPSALSDEHRTRIMQFHEEAYSRLVISGKIYSSRLYWKRARSSRQDVVYLSGQDGDEELHHFASILMFLYDRVNGSVRVLVEEFTDTDPFEHLANLVNHTPHPCRRAALRIMRSLSANNTFFKEITGQRVRVRPVRLIIGPATLAEILNRSYASRF